MEPGCELEFEGHLNITGSAQFYLLGTNTIRAISITVLPGAEFINTCGDRDDCGELRLDAIAGNITTAGSFQFTGTEGRAKDLELEADGDVILSGSGLTIDLRGANMGGDGASHGGTLEIDAEGSVEISTQLSLNANNTEAASFGNTAGDITIKANTGILLEGSARIEASGVDAGSISLESGNDSVINIRDGAVLSTLTRTAEGTPGSLHIDGHTVGFNGTYESKSAVSGVGVPGGQVWIRATDAFTLADTGTFDLIGRSNAPGGTVRIHVHGESEAESEISGVRIHGDIDARSNVSGHGGLISIHSLYGMIIDGEINLSGAADKKGGRAELVSVGDFQLNADGNIFTGEGHEGQILIQTRAGRTTTGIRGSLAALAPADATWSGDWERESSIVIDGCTLELERPTLTSENGAISLVSRANSFAWIGDAEEAFTAPLGVHFIHPPDEISSLWSPDSAWFAEGTDFDVLPDTCLETCDERDDPLDADGDGYPSYTLSETGTDCNDNDPMIHPGATEWLGDGIDSNCQCESDFSLDFADQGFLRRLGEPMPPACDNDTADSPPASIEDDEDDCSDPDADEGTDGEDSGGPVVDPDTGSAEDTGAETDADGTGDADTDADADDGSADADADDGSADADPETDNDDTVAELDIEPIRTTGKSACSCATSNPAHTAGWWLAVGIFGFMRRRTEA